MKRFLKSFGYGQKGFTLVELLVVVGILGILAAVILPNVGKFIGTGTIEAANTEAHNVQTAVIAYMVDENHPDWNGTVGSGNYTSPAPEDFLVTPGRLQATYTIVDGEIASASPLPEGKWKDLTYTPATGWATPAP